MTTRSSLRQSHTVDYTKLEPLPDPPREPDMNQRTTNSAFDSVLIPHYASRGDVLVCGEGYLRQEATNEAETLAPDCVVAFGGKRQGHNSPQRLRDKRGWKAPGLRS